MEVSDTQQKEIIKNLTIEVYESIIQDNTNHFLIEFKKESYTNNSLSNTIDLIIDNLNETFKKNTITV